MTGEPTSVASTDYPLKTNRFINRDPIFVNLANIGSNQNYSFWVFIVDKVFDLGRPYWVFRCENVYARRTSSTDTFNDSSEPPL